MIYGDNVSEAYLGMLRATLNEDPKPTVRKLLYRLMKAEGRP